MVIFDGPATGHLRYVLGVPNAILGAVPAGPLTREARLIRDSIEDPAVTGAVLVGLPEPWPLTELTELAADLEDGLRMKVAATVVNGMWPEHIPTVADPGPVHDLLARLRTVTDRGQERRRVVQEFAARARGETILELPWRFGGIEGRAHLEELLNRLVPAGIGDAQVESA